jgi:transposase
MQLRPTKEYTTEVMDHHGLVAAVCRDLKIADKINQRIGSKDPRRVVQPGVACVAMILNGLGFTNRRLYLTPQFFESKSMSALFDEKIKASDLNEHSLGKAADEIAQYGASRLYAEVVFEIALEQKLLGIKNHLDTTSFTLHGSYNNDEPSHCVEVTHGFSKDHRPDLKQVMMSLVMNGPANIPLWMEPQNGNSSDKTSFHQTIERVNAFKEQLKACDDFMWIADSALYSAEKLLACPDVLWLSRVPETIKACSQLISIKSEDMIWTQGENGYQWSEFCSLYGGIKQRWLLVYSEQAFKREQKTLEKNIEKEKKEALKKCLQLRAKIFGCAHDAEKEIQRIQKKIKYHLIHYTIEPIEKYESRGRPNPQTPKVIDGYRIIDDLIENKETITESLRKKGRFVLGTNQLDETQLPSMAILKEYKSQQNVEGGFRFLKDPWFMLDSFFVKTRERIEALMMCMALCLLVYNFAQYRVRKTLSESDETVPNQLGKPIKNPTVKWLFQCMEGIAIIKNDMMACITNLSNLRQQIIRLFGETACNVYGLTELNSS